MTLLCPCCFDPTQDGLCCAVCTSRLRKALSDLPDLMRELRITLSRQAKITKGSGRRSSEIPLAFGYDAAWTNEAVIGTIGAWIKEIRTPNDADPGQTMTTWCTWMHERIPRIRGHVDVAQIYDELTSIVRAVRRSIDRPADRDFVATCAICSKGVYANSETPPDTWIGCAECKKVAERDEATGAVIGFVPEYRKDMEDQRRLSALRDACVVEHDIVVALRALRDEDYDRRTVWGWIHNYEIGVSLRRAVLPPSACRVEDRVLLYRVEDALQLANRVPARRFGRNRDVTDTLTG